MKIKIQKPSLRKISVPALAGCAAACMLAGALSSRAADKTWDAGGDGST